MKLYRYTFYDLDHRPKSDPTKEKTFLKVVEIEDALVTDYSVIIPGTRECISINYLGKEAYPILLQGNGTFVFPLNRYKELYLTRRDDDTARLFFRLEQAVANFQRLYDWVCPVYEDKPLTIRFTDEEKEALIKLDKEIGPWPRYVYPTLQEANGGSVQDPKPTKKNKKELKEREFAMAQRYINEKITNEEEYKNTKLSYVVTGKNPK